MKVLDADFVRGFIHMADDGWLQGWHERSAGNISYRFKKWEVESVREDLQPKEWQPLSVKVPSLAWEHFLITGTGKEFRNIKMHPEECLCIIEIDGTGENYRIVWGLVNGGKPSRELETHLIIHNVKLDLTSGQHRVIYYAHPTNIMALSFILPPDDVTYTRELWECPLVYPDAVGVVPWMAPGNREIAMATGEVMKEYDVAIWERQGVYISGKDYDTVFGLMHAIEKSAEVSIKLRSINSDKKLALSTEDLQKIAEQFGLEIPEKFLI